MKRALSVAAAIVLMMSGLFASSPVSAAPASQQVFWTFYGWYDNTPPGGGIAYPQIHNSAGGKGTWSDPITFATSSKEAKPGTRIYFPRVKKYFIMEDSCSSCEQDWNGNGPNGGPKLWHFDAWVGGKGGNAMNVIDCEDALTNYHADGKPVMEETIINPPSNLTVDSTPIFNTSTGECYGGAKPKTTNGEYKNVSTGKCLQGGSSGAQLTTATCNGAASQQFKFHGAFMEQGSPQQCTTLSSGKVLLKKCDGGPAQQWSINPNKTISDMQHNTKCYRDASGKVTAASCSGDAAKWTFKAAPTKK
ncbi:RICIN domain-containing protein [Lentzea sp. BCCO 10_0856]|uniref:RICIN domain-containing protein n=1 Tax=Lentzea miocenica TaxID=3095431 RepID=A0ABU4T6J9_9PSEU|nr:RICIN domain-containing protein [Lentzea sp. BCCO 10_0856]MDX8033779.1 RICIN domain-containing protein [Lentzea sp. BCCO 10_0856]